MIGVPDLKVETRRNLGLRLIPREHVVFARDDDLLLGDEVVEREHEAPVEVALSCQRPVHVHNQLCLAATPSVSMMLKVQ